MKSIVKDKRILGYESLSSFPNISHFVTTRVGGCSIGNYTSFNCSPYCGDDSESVRRNQVLLCSELSITPDQLVIPYQIHSTNSLLIDHAYLSASPDVRLKKLYGKDALLTDCPGLCLCISTADCVPILLYDKKHQAIAVVHAGWRGTVDCILSKVFEEMDQAFGTQGDDVVACIGPSISLDSFEIGIEVYDIFKKGGFDMGRIARWHDESRKFHIDLWEANREQLIDCGISPRQIELAGICTFKSHDIFFSARRLGVKSGRILSGIMLRK